SSAYFDQGGVGPQHTSAGNPMFKIVGADSNDGAGPMQLFYTLADTYPLLMVRPFSHNDVSIAFDAYRDSGAWKSSSEDSNSLIFYASPGAAQGSNVTWTNAMQINDTGTVNLSAVDSGMTIVDNSDTTKKITFEVSGVTTATTRTG